MVRYLLFDSQCAVCHGLAQTVERESRGWLAARSLHEHDMQTMLTEARPDWKWEPTLIEVSNHHTRVFTGAALRIKLLSGLGMRRSIRVAHLVQQAYYPRQGITRSRRDVIKGSLAIASGLVFLSGLNWFVPKDPAHAQEEASQSTPTQSRFLATTDSQLVELKNSYAAQAMSGRYGAFDWDHVIEVKRASWPKPGYVVPFVQQPNTTALAFLAISDPASSSPNSAVLGYQQFGRVGQSGTERRIDWTTVGGFHVGASVTTWQDGTTSSSSFEDSPESLIPLSFNTSCFVACFRNCMHINIGANCLGNCLQCGIDVATGTPWFLSGNCLQCLGCSGSQAIACVFDCDDFCSAQD